MTTQDVHHAIAENVRRLRDELGLSQEELAARSGHTRFTIGTVEAGKPARASTLRHIAKALDTTLADLRRGLTPGRDRQSLAREIKQLLIEAKQHRAAGRQEAAEAAVDEAVRLTDELAEAGGEPQEVTDRTQRPA